MGKIADHVGKMADDVGKMEDHVEKKEDSSVRALDYGPAPCKSATRFGR